MPLLRGWKLLSDMVDRESPGPGWSSGEHEQPGKVPELYVTSQDDLAKIWLVETHKFLSQNRYGRKVVLIYTHPGVIDASKFIGRNQRSKKPEEMAKL